MPRTLNELGLKLEDEWRAYYPTFHPKLIEALKNKQLEVAQKIVFDGIMLALEIQKPKYYIAPA